MRKDKKSENRERQSGYFNEIAKLADISADIIGGSFRAEIIENNKLLIENHKGIAEYTSECVRVNCGKLVMSVYGENLTLTAMNQNGLSLSGNITSVTYEN